MYENAASGIGCSQLMHPDAVSYGIGIAPLGLGSNMKKGGVGAA